jgi:hypothetical protein
MAGRNYLGNEAGPVVRPFLLQDGYENEVQLVQQRPLASKALLRFTTLQDEANNKVSDS